MQAIASLVAGYWSREFQKELFNLLSGVFASESMGNHILDVSRKTGKQASISASVFIDALQLLGDAQAQLTAVGMHSAVKSYLKKQNLITTERDSNSVEFDTYQGRRVIVDDGCPVDNGVYTTYLFGQGAIAFGEGSPVGFVQTETQRDPSIGAAWMHDKAVTVIEHVDAGAGRTYQRRKLETGLRRKTDPYRRLEAQNRLVGG